MSVDVYRFVDCKARYSYSLIQYAYERAVSSETEKAVMVTELPIAFTQWYADEHQDIAIELITCGADGWPHLAHLSRGEIVVDDAGHFRMALWQSSRGKSNLLASSRAILILTVPDTVLEIRLLLVKESALPALPELHAFELAPVALRDKSAPYAQIVSALRFKLNSPEQTFTKWAGVREALMTL